MSASVVDLETASKTKAAIAADDSSMWRPVDVLRYVLDQIESGEIETDSLVVAWLTPVEDGPDVRFRISTHGYSEGSIPPIFRAVTLIEKLRRRFWEVNG